MASKLPTRPVQQKGFVQKQPRIKCESHLDFIRSLSCCVCLAPPPTGGSNDPMHLKAGSLFYGKRDTGGGEKASDKWTLPGCRRHHDEQHNMDEMDFWRQHGIDPHLLALILWGCTGNVMVAEEVIRIHRGRT